MSKKHLLVAVALIAVLTYVFFLFSYETTYNGSRALNEGIVHGYQLEIGWIGTEDQKVDYNPEDPISICMAIPKEYGKGLPLTYQRHSEGCGVSGSPETEYNPLAVIFNLFVALAILWGTTQLFRNSKT